MIFTLAFNDWFGKIFLVRCSIIEFYLWIWLIFVLFMINFYMCFEMILGLSPTHQSPSPKERKNTSIYAFILITNFWQVTSEFEEEWTIGKVEGWENNSQENGSAPQNHTVIDLNSYSTVEELTIEGPDKLKEVLFFF